MSKTILSSAASMFLLVGCAKSPPFVVGPDHPANPNAAEASLPAVSQTLAISDGSVSQPGIEKHAGHEIHDSAGGMQDGASETQGRKTQGTQPATTQATSVIYVCPMHPEVTSTQPGLCPKCAMDLVKKEVRR